MNIWSVCVGVCHHSVRSVQCLCVCWCKVCETGGMFLIQCVMLWSVCLLVWSDELSVSQPYKVLSTNGSALVRCAVHPPDSYLPPEPEELRVSLLKGLHTSQVVCLSTFNPTEPTAAGVQRGQVQCSAKVREGAVELSVSGLRATDTDLYRCQIEVLFPPPYLRLRGNGTLIHVLEGSECPVQEAQRRSQQADEDEDEERGERTAPVSVPVVVLVILVSVALLFIIYLQALQCKDWRREMVRPVPVPVQVPGVHYKGDAAFSC